LVAVLDAIRRTAALLLREAEALQEVNKKMASGAADQSDTVDRTTTTVEALSDKIDRIAQNAEDAAEACVKARHEASRGLEQLHTVIEGMDRLRSQVEASGRKARRLGDRSQEIGAIVELIRGISSRTDMLALNATIESVRAGEHGRGFAVVAEEIRKLAERTAAATREIGTLVEAIQADTHESIRALSEEQTQMDQELHRVRDAGTALERISEVAEHSARLVEGISRSTNDQVLATQDLVRAMQRISEVSHLALEGTERSRDHIEEICRSCKPFQRLSPPEEAPSFERSAVSMTKSWGRKHRVYSERTA
jgi:twitching motility protein PilJ